MKNSNDLNSYKGKRIKEALIKLIMRYCSNWLTPNSFDFTVNFEEVIDEYSEHKMELIKNHLCELKKENKNFKDVYDIIKDFEDIRDLLNYLSPRSYYTPEATLHFILENSDHFIVKKHEDYNDRYVINKKREVNLPESKDKLQILLKQFFRLYTKIIFDVKKSAFSLSELYNMVLEEEIDYDYAKSGEYIIHLLQENDQTIQDILKIAGSELNTPKEIYCEIIRRSYRYFYNIVDDYYGLKDWDDRVKFNVHIKIFDEYRNREGENKKKDELGKEVLALISKIDLKKNKRRRIERLIKKNIGRG